VARAKRTDRADARRRYRQFQTTELDDDEGESPPASSGPASGPPRAAAGPVERPSITAAFRNAYHPAHIREDIAALPWLLRSRAFLISLALVIGGTIAASALPGNAISVLVFQALVIPPAMAPIFVTGFFAKRASYLLGLIIGIVDVAAYAAYIYLVAPSLATQPIDPALQQQAVYSAISVGPASGVLFAAAAAWYRRFLALSNASAAQRAKARQQQRARAGKPARG
jgi:hypothetical protein